ncbi:MAG: polyphenol oxidase family protein [Acidimicrobiales bacterium]
MSDHRLSPIVTAGPVRLLGTPVLAFWTGVSEGDQRGIVQGATGSAPSPVPHSLRVAGAIQVHGSAIISVGTDISVGTGDGAETAEADGVVATDELSCPAVLTADCVSVAMGSPEGIRAAVHAGWRGLVRGVIGNAASVMRSSGASKIVASFGPCIGPCCYEFSPDDLSAVESELGTGLRAITTSGHPSLDIRLAARRVLEKVNAEVIPAEIPCTSCGNGWFSARARKDVERQALYVWRDK